MSCGEGAAQTRAAKTTAATTTTTIHANGQRAGGRVSFWRRQRRRLVESAAAAAAATAALCLRARSVELSAFVAAAAAGGSIEPVSDRSGARSTCLLLLLCEERSLLLCGMLRAPVCCVCAFVCVCVRAVSFAAHTQVARLLHAHSLALALARWHTLRPTIVAVRPSVRASANDSLLRP